jgi:hypothetical protein
MGKNNYYRKRYKKGIQQYRESKEYQKLKERFERDKMFEQQIRAWEYVVTGLKDTESKPKILMTKRELLNLNRWDMTLKSDHN